jgi:hypothetical protein
MSLTPGDFLVGAPIPLGLTTVTLPTGTTSYYIHNQTIALATWTITHNFNRIPSVTLIGADNAKMYTDIEYPNDTTVVVTFAAPRTGKALLV